MGTPVRIRQFSKGEPWAVLLLCGIGALLYFYFTFEQHYAPADMMPPPVWFVLRALCLSLVGLAPIALVVGYLRRSKRDLVVDSDGIRVERDREIVWAVRWDQFGGFRNPAAKASRAPLAPMSIEVLDLARKPVGRARITGLGGPYRRARFVRALAARVPSGGTVPLVKERRPRVPAPYLKNAVLGFAALMALAWVALLVELLGARIHRSLSLPIMAGAFSAWLFGFLGMVGCSVFYARYRRIPGTPAVGPTLEDFLTDEDGHPQAVTMEDGVRYRYVHPDALRARVESTQRLCLTETLLCAAYLPLPILELAVHTDVADWLNAGAFIAFFVGIILMIRGARRTVSKLSATFDATFTMTAENVIAELPDGKHTFPGRPRRMRRSLANLTGALRAFGVGSQALLVDSRYLRPVELLENWNPKPPGFGPAG